MNFRSRLISRSANPRTSNRNWRKLLREGFLIQNAQHCIFAVDRRHDGHPKIDRTAAVSHPEAAVLRDAAFGDVQFRHHLDAGDEVGLELSRQRRHGLLKRAIDPELHHQGIVPALDVDIAGPPLEAGKNN